jgi:hypothetical protein
MMRSRKRQARGLAPPGGWCQTADRVLAERGAPAARREEGEYSSYLTDEQRSGRGPQPARRREPFDTSLLVRGVARLALALGLTASCGFQDIPHAPTYEADIRPLVLSRCVRCHGGGGTLNADPTALPPFHDFAPINGYFDHFEDQNCGADAPPAGCKHGLFFYATDMAKKAQLTGFIDSHTDNRMPPKPSPALTSTQLQIFHTWLDEGPPLEK